MSSRRTMAMLLLAAVLAGPGCAPAVERGRASGAGGQTTATPPGQPASGPGGRDYRHASVTRGEHGRGALAYWLYAPADPTPSSAPVVLFLHGWNGQDPYYYGGWIEHLVRRGNVVIYPVFQVHARHSAEEMMDNAIQATRDALARLGQGPVRPELDRFVIVGHSFGGGLTAQIAARAARLGLPTPRAIMPVQPGWKGSDVMPTAELGGIPATTLMLIVLGMEDQFARTRHDAMLWQHTAHIPETRRRVVGLQSDRHGTPPLIADHSSPLAPRRDYAMPGTEARERRRALFMQLTGMRDGEEDALDFYGYWRLLDALMEAAFADRTIDGVVADRSMGTWSDGTPVKPMLVLKP